jgi:PAS domain-containing protein
LPELLASIAAAAEVLAGVGDDGSLYVLDRYGTIEFMDERGLRILGYAGDELRGKPDHETIHYRRLDGTAFHAAECPLLRPWSTGETRRVERDWFIAKDGSFVPVAYAAAALPLADASTTLVAFRVRPSEAGDQGNPRVSPWCDAGG